PHGAPSSSGGQPTGYTTGARSRCGESGPGGWTPGRFRSCCCRKQRRRAPGACWRLRCSQSRREPKAVAERRAEGRGGAEASPSRSDRATPGDAPGGSAASCSTARCRS
ncbi:unnamed protein product, partial [Symbiodinium natans]